MKKSESGTMLIVAVLVLATLAVCVALALEYTSTIGRDVKRSNTRQRAMEIGNGAIEMAFAGWRDVCRQSMNTSLATSAFTSIPMPVGANFPGITPFTASRGANPNPPATQYTIANFTVKAVDPQMIDLADNNTAPPPATGRSAGTTSIFLSRFRRCDLTRNQWQRCCKSPACFRKTNYQSMELGLVLQRPPRNSSWA